MSVEVEFRLDEAALQQVLTGPDGPIAIAVASIAQEIVNIAKSLAPVDTGRLRASIVFLLGRTQNAVFAEIGTNVEYAPYQEFGTKYMTAQPFLIPALLRVSGRLSGGQI